jgi:hypothetical protein
MSLETSRCAAPSTDCITNELLHGTASGRRSAEQAGGKGRRKKARAFLEAHLTDTSPASRRQSDPVGRPKGSDPLLSILCRRRDLPLLKPIKGRSWSHNRRESRECRLRSLSRPIAIKCISVSAATGALRPDCGKSSASLQPSEDFAPQSAGARSCR